MAHMRVRLQRPAPDDVCISNALLLVQKGRYADALQPIVLGSMHMLDSAARLVHASMDRESVSCSMLQLA